MKSLTKKYLIFSGVSVLLCCCLLIAACTTAQTQPYVSPYDWSGLIHQKDRLSYSENGVPASRQGIDVSEHQGNIDWQAVANDGIDFAIISVGNRGYTQGALFVDDFFLHNIQGATDAELDVGVYFFSQAITAEEAREEAGFVLDQLQGRALDIPVVFDHEPVGDPAGRANGVSGQLLADITNAFCERIEAAGYQSMVYGNQHDIARFGSASFGNRPVWLAEYGVTTPTAAFDFVMWQYSNGGSVAGISTNVDMNIQFLVD